MTRDDIIRMAREAGLLCPIDNSTNNLYEDWVDLTPYIERFAQLVAAKYEQKIEDLENLVTELLERQE
jgi:hypothetical protein